MNSRISTIPPSATVPSDLQNLVQVLDWRGHRAAVSYTFDDSNSSQLEHFDELMALEVPFSFYLWTEKNESQSELWARALEKGHELGNHSHTHQKDGPDIASDTDLATEFIQDHFDTPVWTMAAPYGSTAYGAVAETRFLMNRGVKEGIILPMDQTDRFDLNCYIPPEGAQSSAYEEKVDAARASGGWQIILVHGFLGGTDQAYQPVGLSEFLGSVKYTKSLGDVWVGTLVDVGAYWLGQAAFVQARVKKRADEVTYQWDLPPHFPPDKFLLVRSSGRQLSQHGKPLTATTSGLYEIALDARSLSVLIDG